MSRLPISRRPRPHYHWRRRASRRQPSSVQMSGEEESRPRHLKTCENEVHVSQSATASRTEQNGSPRAATNNSICNACLGLATADAHDEIISGIFGGTRHCSDSHHQARHGNLHLAKYKHSQRSTNAFATPYPVARGRRGVRTHQFGTHVQKPVDR